MSIFIHPGSTAKNEPQIVKFKNVHHSSKSIAIFWYWMVILGPRKCHKIQFDGTSNCDIVVQSFEYRIFSSNSSLPSCIQTNFRFNDIYLLECIVVLVWTGVHCIDTISGTLIAALWMLNTGFLSRECVVSSFVEMTQKKSVSHSLN